MKTAIIAFTLFMLPQSGFAFPAVNGIIEQGAERFAANARRNVTGCVDLSGSWKGTCTAQGQSVGNALTIVQKGCTSIKMNNDEETIGALKSTSVSAAGESDNAYAISAASFLDWNQEGNALKVHISGLVKALGKSGHLPLNGDGTFRLEGNTLHLDVRILGVQASCQYHK